MIINKLYFPDKLLSITTHNKHVIVSTANGQIYRINEPYNTADKTLIYSNASPVSCVKWWNGHLIFGDWNGCVRKMKYNCSCKTCDIVMENSNCELSLDDAIIKCLAVFNEEVFISIDTFLIVLDTDLNIKNKINLDNRILCFSIINNELYMGMSVPSILVYKDGIVRSLYTGHTSSVLCICECKKESDNNTTTMLITASADKTLMKDNVIVYSGDEWIRVCLDDYFTDGNTVREKDRLLYEHKGYVVGLERNEKYLFSIGLDCCLIIYGSEKVLEEYEDEIARLNDEY